MKKILLLSLCLSLAGISNAQEVLTDKQGHPILPKAGDYSLGFDAAPFITYFGNLFNHGSNNSPEALFTQQHPMTISGMYLKKDDLAYRGKIRVGFGTEKSDTMVQKNGSTNPNETVANETKRNTSNITLGLGMQKWRGYGRLRAFYGGEILFGVGTDKTTYTYGNALSNENQDTRNTSYKPGNTISFSLRGIIGVEYFFAPKVSFSAEYGWGPSVASKGQGELVREKWNGGGLETVTTNTGKSSKFLFDNDNNGGSINLNFYF
ncbi:MAG TPA: hypothetical protein PLG57_13650 [Bacteroidia bacterium]|nr:hypothetical protein [Bacteroidia bacterium]